MFASADEPTLRGPEWIETQWEAARLRLRDREAQGALLVLDEVQKVPRWSETVNRLWDADTRARLPLKVVLLGSAPLLIQQGMTEPAIGQRIVLDGDAHLVVAVIADRFWFPHRGVQVWTLWSANAPSRSL